MSEWAATVLLVFGWLAFLVFVALLQRWEER